MMTHTLSRREGVTAKEGAPARPQHALYRAWLQEVPEEGRGFTFKWFANQWLEDYLDLRRPGSWVPPIGRICPDPRGTGLLLLEGGGIWSDSSESD